MRFTPTLNPEFVNPSPAFAAAREVNSRVELPSLQSRAARYWQRLWSSKMDIALSLTGIAFFALMLGYVRACDRF
jgi:hypothetical protein